MKPMQRELELRALREAQWQSQAVPNSVTNSPPVTVTNKLPVTNTPAVTNAGDVERVLRWRATNRDRYRDYMRDLMRERRAKETAT